MDRLLPSVRYGPEVCRNLETATRLEWLETNGLGGFASSTISGINTRRYHALLVAATTPPTGRVVLLNKIDETVIIDGRAWALGANRFPGAIHPMGHLNLFEFRLDPFPRWIYRFGDHLLERTLFMPHGRNAVVLTYRWVDDNLQPLPDVLCPKATLKARVFTSFRDYHHLGSANPYFNGTPEVSGNTLILRPYQSMQPLTIDHSGFDFEPSPEWYHNFEYEMEKSRGLDFQEDIFTCGELVKNDFRSAAQIMAFLGKNPTLSMSEGRTRAVPIGKVVDMLIDKEINRRSRLLRGFEQTDDLTKRLVVAADQFIVERGRGGYSIIAGYPWFADWGRDTMISLPGLTLATRRFDLAKTILSNFAKYCRHGLIPNNFPDRGEEPSYNSIDATLWFFVAAHEYEKASGDTTFIPELLWPVFKEIIDTLQRGTIYDIRVDSDGLISAGNPGTQLTWMDACVDGNPITPRHGKAVEINCLWYNALRIAATAAARAGESAHPYDALATRLIKNFQTKFWNASAGCLYDLINENGPDQAIRPNQIFALSLPFPLISGGRAHVLLDIVKRLLLTPVGLRSLSPGHPAYSGVYGGGVADRDGAYHQGTVWGWLLGPYVKATLDVKGDTPKTRAELTPVLAAMESHLFQAGINSVSEIFDGEPPNEPRGCIAQAWSVAEWLNIVSLLRS